MTPQTASGGISRERFKRGSPNFTWLSGTAGYTNLSGIAVDQVDMDVHTTFGESGLNSG